MSSIKLDIVTPQRTVYSKEINMVIAKAKSGELGIMPGHTPILATLQAGVMRVKVNDSSHDLIAVSGGFLEVSTEQITVLARTAELQSEIDINRAKEAKERAEKRLKDTSDKIDHTRAKAALDRAMARLKTKNFK
ncbi:F0F1 ATP synthase subunit epsilon [Clostridium sp. 'deep sea']|uniref:F0F1 ATP synthase subunit epsilon n=1 Tax=Clostridium sp. 'deep sea' TaxID=2779445 RepID=UPI0018965235|nr:F0F1 ATP synthase subunit epsilon [Clostridium sp. 'deep sea']QOR33777.1 F0F1 ATP synthase subunit epsilon [Clostridium sp. 'deep sea']